MNKSKNEISKANTNPSILHIKSVSKKETQHLKNNLTKSASKPIGFSLTFGERLYYKNMALSNIKESKIKKQREKRENSFEKEFKFVPSINKSYTFNKKTSLNKEENSKQYTPLTTEQTKELNDIEEINKYKPTKKSSDEIAQLSERLHNEKKVNEIKRKILTNKILSQECPFTPDINEKVEKPKVENFFYRLQNWINTLNNKINIINNTEPTDYKTGQVLFKPCIYSNYPKRENTFDLLYLQGLSQKVNREIKEEDNYKRIESLSNVKKVSPNSEALVEIRQQKIAKELFEIMNIEKDGALKYSEEMLKKLHDTFSEKFYNFFRTYLIEDLKNTNETLNIEEFTVAMEQLYPHMTFEIKEELNELIKKKKD